MVSPARGFYATAGLGVDQVRIAYVLNSADLRDAVGILAAGLETYARERNSPRTPTLAVSPSEADRVLPHGT